MRDLGPGQASGVSDVGDGTVWVVGSSASIDALDERALVWKVERFRRHANVNHRTRTAGLFC